MTRLLAAAALFFSSQAFAAPLGLPGTSWGEVTRDMSDVDGTGTQGRVTQGVRWARWGDVKFETPASYRWRARTRDQRFYDSNGPGIGGLLTWKDLNLGVERSWQRFPVLGRTEEDFQIYLSGFHRWDLAKVWRVKRLGPLPILGLPLSLWANLAHDLNDVEGDSAQGSLVQAVDWVKLGPATLSTFAAFRWRIRSRNTRFFNAYGPEAGLKADVGPFTLGGRYVWRTYRERDLFVRNWELFLNWYFRWDLRDLAAR